MKKTCIIVDDAGFIRELIKSIAVEQNYQILAEASSGDKALKIFKVYSPDILFLDLVLPDVNGMDLLKNA
ncbi:MAG TPA: response regulator, partial [Pseudobdellovibrionaceae bacterium]|nr:response regulator [Pseudobdellovibrionaceae bacterium]